MAIRKTEPKILSRPEILIRPANKRTSARMRAFLAAFERTGSKTEAARLAKIDRKLHYRKFESDPLYRKAFEEVEQRAIDGLEDEAWRRARKGSDGLMMFLLRGLRPERYREHVVQEHSGSVTLVQVLEAARQRVFEMRQGGNQPAGTS
jgi:hypothetical protein